MTDPRQLLDHHASIISHGLAAYLATIVLTRGSSYRKAGARLLFDETGRTTGCVSGGCLERDLKRRAPWITRDGPAIVVYDSDELDEGGHGLGCGGTVHVLVERVDGSSTFFLEMRSWLSRRTRALVATVIEPQNGSLLGDRTWFYESIERNAAARGSNDVYLERWEPLSGVTLFGIGPETTSLVHLLRGLEFRVAVGSADTSAPKAPGMTEPDATFLESDPRALARRAIEFGEACVVMTRSLSLDREILRAMIPSAASYIGVLGPRHRTERLLGELCENGLVISEAQRARVSAPAGIRIACDGPFDIALSIAAELKMLRGRHKHSVAVPRDHSRNIGNAT